MEIAKQTVWYYLHERYRSDISGLISKQFNDVHIVDEIEQETWLGVFSSLPRFHGWSKKRKTKVTPRTWIAKIAKNKVCDYVRRKVHQSRFVSHDEDGNDLLVSIADTNPINQTFKAVLAKEQNRPYPGCWRRGLKNYLPPKKMPSSIFIIPSSW